MRRESEAMFIRVLWLVVLLPFACAGLGDLGYDRPYDDLPGMPITLAQGSDATACAKLCQQNTDCVAWVFSTPEQGCSSPYLCWLKNPLPPLVKADCRVSGVKEKLAPMMYSPLNVGELQPAGWLHNQLELQADGLSGYLALFWPDIANSTWIGGQTTDPGGVNERVPYWLNGMVPLAFLLPNHKQVNEQVRKYVNYIISHQTSDGWFGADCCDPWPRYPLLLALSQYSEGNSSDGRMVPAILKGLKRLRMEIEKYPLTSWAQYRWQDLSLTVYWMYDKHPELQEQDFLWDMAEILRVQGFAWDQFFASQQFPHIACRGTCPSLATHGVNVGQAIKSSAVGYRQSQSVMDYYSTQQRIQAIDRYHGQASGIFSCSEHLAGLVPSQGSETCTVVETMFSFDILFSVFGNVSYADRVEQLAFNALPAALTPEMWAHVYLQQGNQINAAHNDPNIYVTDGPDSNIYGLEPNFGCCTVNFPQGWPKLATQLMMKTADGSGLVAAFYAPSNTTTTIKGKRVSIVLDTNYPFSEKLLLAIDASIDFPFFLRIPEWAIGATVQIDQSAPAKAQPGQLYQANIRTGRSTVRLILPMEFRIQRRYNNAISIYRGPLLYVLNMDEKWVQLKHYAFNSSDWQIDPITPWNYALKVDVNNPSASIQFFSSNTIGPLPFSSNGTPVKAVVQGRLLPAWGIVDNAAAPPPPSPVTSSEPLERLVLVPYGAARLRIAEFPLLVN